MRVLPLMALSLVVVAACHEKAEAPAPGPTEVRVLSLQSRPAAVTVDYAGTVEAAEEVEIRARVSGLLERRLATEGQAVRRGQPLFQLDRQPLADAVAQAEAALSQAEAATAQTTREYARARELAAGDALSQQELDAALARHQNATAAVKSARAALTTARSNLGYAAVTSPIDGLMGRAELKDGALVSAYSSRLTTVYATDPVHVNFALSEAELAALEQQQGPLSQHPPKVRLLRADGSAYALTPELDLVDPAVNPDTGTIGLRLRVANGDQALRPGQYLRVRVTTRELPAAVLVPQRAVQELQGKRSVWVVDAAGQAQPRDLQLGERIGADWLVLAGLKAGETVIVDGAQRLKPGTPVKPLPAEAAPAP